MIIAKKRSPSGCVYDTFPNKILVSLIFEGHVKKPYQFKRVHIQASYLSVLA